LMMIVVCSSCVINLRFNLQHHKLHQVKCG
jgi:hypothetical protein